MLADAADAAADRTSGENGSVQLPASTPSPFPTGLDARRPRPNRVIDSFLVLDGEAVRAPAHLDRFRSSVLAQAPTSAAAAWSTAIDALWAGLLEQLPATGAWFPLLEARWFDGSSEPRLTTAVRPAPALRSRSRLRIAADARRFPRLKGADQALSEALRTDAQRHGDDDALLLDARGRITEAANGTVIGWRDQTLLLPNTRERLPSITLEALLDDFRAHGGSIESTQLRPDTTAELWYLNSLHGITAVDAIDGVPSAPDAARLREWRQRSISWWSSL